MENTLYIAASPSSPEVDFRFDEGVLSLRGESYPENAAAFYGDIIRQLRAYLGSCKQRTITVNIALAYFNSSSTKMLFNIIEALAEAVEAGGNRVTLHWFHDAEDDTIHEFGQELVDDFPAIAFVMQPVGTV
ncbi:DUF1987 domain-containing protein [Paucibacter sp. O1-1]|uniref:DUF1987 domain-containing protein n=1 Tax=Roseateles TaxID=93681 RepID=UPI0021D4A465|nr:DUF1987 domain-containing protein [Paucibacter sp. M5-1]MCU7372684.1 DUF1987 domain-containing protein [Paucibacter sp. O1-1]MCZ7882772.1 DUF1987 domain-containing protein [Paucibacter sp. M5-1]MDA3827678.1 DUF1987 domain-containing protein [Paucibacter sp. O1-1]